MKSVEQKYKRLSDVEHCLTRPGMYVGSIKMHNSEVFLLDSKNQFEKVQVTYNPAFLKIFDEIISNSVDEHKRNPKLNKIEVTIDIEKGMITIWDNGGIPVQKHKEYDEWIPELLFSSLKTGSNFDDSEERLVAGTNGVGATLTNIFSKEFKIKTCDGKKTFEQVFTNNMHERENAKIGEGSKGYTEISYIPDLERFSMTSIDQIHFALMKKRVIDAAACNPKLQVGCNGESFIFKSFKDYTKYYINDVFYEESDRWKIGIGLSEDGFQQVSFVNSVETKDGGTHVEYVLHQITQWLREKIKKKYKVEVKPSELKNHMFLFVEASIVNSGFSSQTKEKLITEPKDFGSYHEVSENILKLVFNSEIIKQLLDWIQEKKLADERKQLRALNKFLDKTKIIKLIDAKSKDNREKCSLAIFEGDCLHESTLITVFDENGKNDIEIKNAEIGQHVLTHENRIRKIIAKTSKISKLLEIKTKYGSIKASAEHRFYVYDTEKDSFIWVKCKDLNLTIHKLVRNKMQTITKASIIKKIKREKNEIIFITDDSRIVSTLNHKMAIYSTDEEIFDLKEANDIKITDLIIYN